MRTFVNVFTDFWKCLASIQLICHYFKYFWFCEFIRDSIGMGQVFLCVSIRNDKLAGGHLDLLQTNEFTLSSRIPNTNIPLSIRIKMFSPVQRKTN